jgi:hypothetical protein
MNYDNTITLKAEKIREMANEGRNMEEILSNLRIKKNELKKILEQTYCMTTKNTILYTISLNNIDNNDKNEVIVVDTSFLIEMRFWEIEDFLMYHTNVIIPGPVLEEIITKSKDERLNFNSRRIRQILFDFNVRVEISDSTLELDPAWTRNNDFYILTVCIKLKNQGLIVKLLSNDYEMLLKARGLGIEKYYMDDSQNSVKYRINDLAGNKGTFTIADSIIKPAKCVEKKKTKPLDKKNHRINKVLKFEKTKISKDIDDNDYLKPDIISVNGNMRLQDTSSIDMIMCVLKFVVTSNGKIKESLKDENSKYYSIDEQDKIIIFSKINTNSIRIEIGKTDENGEYVVVDNQILEGDFISNINSIKISKAEESGEYIAVYNQSLEGDSMDKVRKIYKEYKEPIKEAFAKLLKIKLNKAI